MVAEPNVASMPDTVSTPAGADRLLTLHRRRAAGSREQLQWVVVNNRSTQHADSRLCPVQPAAAAEPAAVHRNVRAPASVSGVV